MAKSLPAPDPFPGMRPDGPFGPSAGTSSDTPAWALDSVNDARDYDVAPDPNVQATITPGNKGLAGGVKAAPNPFPGAPGSQPGGGDGSGGTSGNNDGPLNVSTVGGYNSGVGGMTVMDSPNAFPGGFQIPDGAPDSTGTTGPRRLRSDPSSGTMP